MGINEYHHPRSSHFQGIDVYRSGSWRELPCYDIGRGRAMRGPIENIEEMKPNGSISTIWNQTWGLQAGITPTYLSSSSMATKMSLGGCAVQCTHSNGKGTDHCLIGFPLIAGGTWRKSILREFR